MKSPIALQATYERLPSSPKLWPDLTLDEKIDFADSLSAEEIEDEALRIELDHERTKK